MDERKCANCLYWVANYVGPQEWGWCSWRSCNHKPSHPTMLEGMKFHYTDHGQNLETQAETTCEMWEPDDDRK